MKKKLVITLFIILSAGIWVFFKYRSPSEEAAPGQVWVQTAVVKTSTLPLEAHAIGTLVARSVEITPELAGHVRNIYFQDGAFVSKDTPLIQLDDSVYKAKYESTKAQLAFSQNDFNRKTLLVKQGAVTRAAIDQADADLKEKTANAQENAVMVSKMRLNAPFDGVVGKSKVNLGDYVTTGQSIVTLTDTRHLRIEYSVPEKYLPSLKSGQEVKITTSTYPGKEFFGKVSFISPTINTENRSVFLYADVPNNTNELAPGMFVNVTHSLGTEEKVLMIPARSLVPILDGEQVYKVVNGKAYAATVLIGKRISDSVQVLQGLSPGDVVITDGQLKIKNGMPVQIKS
ncbi:Multidrug export protein AcrE [Aquicella siphonis]|uniref:Multidrug export protein AcrE n=1 Tax=Aquicella siphonis TaxID=254247 RepID=A0A5E4PH22_9COXI|nr:efflux RND transporter periplasmic adaptor subunit [Aquicella siphonis]VVC75895.1 Multidrug export protein AcrE [Aquicella siphonis]